MTNLFLADLAGRGLVKDCSDLGGLSAAMDRGRIAVYAGFDPTAPSLHAGHLLALSLLRRFMEAGHSVIPVIGTATGLVGDPSGRSAERPLMDSAALAANVNGVRRSIQNVLGSGIDIRENGDWISGVGFVEFLREAGRHVGVPRMLALDSVRSRLQGEGTISFMEFSYSLLQAWDFAVLAREHPALLQVGGSDQWGNICMGLELIRRRGVPCEAFGMTHPLLTKADGTKMGKTAGGAAWLNAEMMRPFDFYQFWRDVPDSEVTRLLSLLTEAMPSSGDDPNAMKADLARRMTRMVHGDAAAIAADAAARDVFDGDGIDGLRCVQVRLDTFADPASLLVVAGLAESKSAARRLIRQGGMKIGGRTVADGETPRARAGETIRLSAGKKRHVALQVTAD
jgi:tyrosyl-tRNA synthetase